MSTREHNLVHRIPQENLAEAGVWLARLKGPSRDKKLEQGFRDWLTASPLNARAFEATTDVWQEAANLSSIVSVPPVRRRFSRVAVAVGVCASAALALVAWILMPQGVATGVGEQRTLNLEDGTHVFLNTSTRVVVRYDRTARRIELKNGEALFNVAQRANWPFIVTVQDHEVRALGTSFVVRHDSGRLDVTLIDGKVSISARGVADDMALEPGEHLSITSRSGVKIDWPKLDSALAWRRGQVILDDTPLLTAVEEMNRYSTIKLTVERPQAGRLRINGLFQAGDSKSFAEAVALNYGLEVVSRNGGLVLAGVPTH